MSVFTASTTPMNTAAVKSLMVAMEFTCVSSALAEIRLSSTPIPGRGDSESLVRIDAGPPGESRDAELRSRNRSPERRESSPRVPPQTVSAPRSR